MLDFRERIKHLQISVDRGAGGDLRRESQFRFSYSEEASQPVSLIMPVEDREYADNALFAVMDMNLPEGFLLAQIRERSPKNPPTEMQLLALMGANGIGRLAYQRPGAAAPPLTKGVDRAQLLRDGAGRRGAIFAQLVDAFLATGSGLSGIQPKIIVPERATFPIPNMIVKAGGSDYVGLAANEYLCLQVAQQAGLPVPEHALSDDGALLVIDRFDLRPDGERLGFEDVAALADLRVGGALSDRKYRGSYEDVTAVIDDFATDRRGTRAQLFEYVALTILLRNGDGHLKNFGVLYDRDAVWLAPVYDIATTTIYPYERADGVRVTDRTMALKLRVGDRKKGYPLRSALLRFGEQVCFVRNPAQVLDRIREAMDKVLTEYLRDKRMPARMLKPLTEEWQATIKSYGVHS